MPRIALGVEYDGGAFSGWERQRDRRTVQSVLEEALARIADHPVRTVCAGRTDAGVHALAQVVHLECRSERPEAAWTLGVNTHLPPDVSVRWMRPVPGDFHARYSARRRSYRYVILNRRLRSALERGRVTWVHRPLDERRMASAAAHLVGEHDFSAYRASGCQARNPVRTVHRLRVTRRGDRVLVDVTANAFLHHMVRNIAGVLIAIGAGREAPDWARRVLESRDRARGGITAPPQGLYLTAVRYPRRFALPGVTRGGGVW